jgi:hypothetical protein
MASLPTSSPAAGIQVVKPGIREPDPAVALAVNERFFHKGPLMFAPSLDISRDALQEGILMLGEAIEEVLG